MGQKQKGRLWVHETAILQLNPLTKSTTNNFCDPHWELICRNKWHPGNSEISAPQEIAVGTHLYAQHGNKTTPIFLLDDGETSWLLLPSSVFILSGGTVQPENTYSCIHKVTGQVWESQERISINTIFTATTSVHLPKPVSTDLTINLDSVLTNPIGKDGVPSWSK